MDIKVTITEIKEVQRTYFVKGVNSLQTAEKCAYRCAGRDFQPNTYLYREVPCRPYYRTNGYEIVNSD